MTETAIGLSELSHAFDTMLGGIPPKTLEGFAEKRNLLCQGGYRSGGNPALLRALVGNALRGGLMTYDASLAAFLREHVSAVRMLTMLSREVLADRRCQWMGLFGKACFILALLCDAREDVRTEAMAWAASSGAELPDSETAQAALSRLFGPAFKSGEAVASSRDREKIGQLTEEVQSLKSELKTARREQSAAARKEAADLKAELATAKYNVDERNRTIVQLESRLAKEEETREAKARLAAAAAQVRLFRGWLEPAIRAEAALAEPGPADLRERVEAALDAQLKADRAASGSARLRERLEGLTALAIRVDETLRTALVPQRSLKLARSELEAEIRRLETALGKKEQSPAATLLETRIHAALREEEYEALGEAIALLEKLALVTADEAKALRRLRVRRMSVWDEAPFETDKSADPDTASAAILRRNPELVSALRGESALFLFLDGHNMLNGLGRYKLRRGDAKTHEDARKMLERDIRVLVAPFPMVYAHLVWDGPTMSSYSISENVEGHYSGGEGEHRADRFILDQIRYYGSRESVAMVLVTDDMGFAGEARRLGAKSCRLHDFGAFLNGPAR